MKKALMIVPFAALAFTAVFSGSKPLPVHAEGEEVSSVVETSVESSEEASKKFDVNSVTIDGKTVEEWKRDLKDESTRNAALMAILMSAIPTLLFLIKWLTDRNLISKAKKVQEDAFVALEEINKLRVAVDSKASTYFGKVEEKTAELEDKLQKAQIEAQKTHELLELIMKTDPKLVAADAYAKAKKQVEEKYGK